jgi:dsRNA-specific ribonuclease
MSDKLDMSEYASKGKIRYGNIELNVMQVGDKFHACVLMDGDEYGRGISDNKHEAVQTAFRTMLKEFSAEQDRLLDFYSELGDNANANKEA